MEGDYQNYRNGLKGRYKEVEQLQGQKAPQKALKKQSHIISFVSLSWQHI